MNAIENIERTLEELGQSLRGGGAAHVNGLQPRDVLHTVLESLEEHRIEGLDHKIYAPNAYTVQLALDDEERSRLLPFLGHEELEASIQRYCQERKYHFRGPLALKVVNTNVAEAAESEAVPNLDPRGTRPVLRSEAATKVRVLSQFDVPQTSAPEMNSQVITIPSPK